MIISKTPYRVSFFGGGTDFPSWSKIHGGQVLSTTINKYCYISCRYLPSFFEHKFRFVYSVIETVKNINDIQHPTAKAVLAELKIKDGLEIHYDGDLPARSGLGSSSAFTVGLLNALYGLRGHRITKKELSLESIRIEQEVVKENVGCQDQIAIAHGGLNVIKFLENGEYRIEPIITPRARYESFQSHLMLFFTGVSRISSEIALDMINNIGYREKEIKLIGTYVDEGINILTDENRNLIEFGSLLNETWKVKKSLSRQISNSKIDSIYNKAVQAGAIGGKILGAGGGGFILFFVEPEKQELVKKALSSLVYVPVNFERQGSQIILYEPEGF
tara:strand:- start:1637 stop:2632 length:996 start_codon:yes stop_codon:yes gene_type:complete